MRISDWSSDVCSSDLPVLILHQRDEGGTVGVIFQALDSRRNVPLAPLEIDDPVTLLMTAADAARSGVAHVVAAAAAVLSFGKRLDRLALPQAGPVDKPHAALGGATVGIFLQCPSFRVLPLT